LMISLGWGKIEEISLTIRITKVWGFIGCTWSDELYAQLLFFSVCVTFTTMRSAILWKLVLLWPPSLIQEGRPQPWHLLRQFVHASLLQNQNSVTILSVLFKQVMNIFEKVLFQFDSQMLIFLLKCRWPAYLTKLFK
jgi:hypothetical protein